MIIYLVRHGETDYNKFSKLQGWADIPLNEYGIELAKKTADGMKDIIFDHIFSSPLIRAYKTAEIILGNRNIKIEKDDRLKEIGFGSHEGDTLDLVINDANHPIHNFACNPDKYIPSDGSESFEDVKKRVNEFLNEKIIPLEKECKNILIVAHGGVNNCIINQILGIEIKNFWDTRLPNCAVTKISLKNSKFDVIEKSKVYY